jgi:hypothetical protein
MTEIFFTTQTTGCLAGCQVVCQPAILSTCHFISSVFHQLAILSDCHFVKLPFCQLAIFLIYNFVSLQTSLTYFSLSVGWQRRKKFCNTCHRWLSGDSTPSPIKWVPRPPRENYFGHSDQLFKMSTVIWCQWPRDSLNSLQGWINT